MQHAASHTTTIQPSSYNEKHILIGKQWYQLPEQLVQGCYLKAERPRFEPATF